VVTVHPFSFPPHPKENALALLIGLTLLTGRATASRGNWSKDGAGPDDLARDRYACIQESRVPIPRPMVQACVGRCERLVHLAWCGSQSAE
jgi:hypothetical protein